MATVIDLNLIDLNDYIEKKCGGKEYFLGCWSADNFETKLKGHFENIQYEQGGNWFVLRNGADRVNGLIFPKKMAEDPEITIFKGYLAEEGIHSYSHGDAVKKYWANNKNKKHNGIFTAATITEGGKKLNLITDIFGIGPLFTRKVGRNIFFSNAAGLLSLKDDVPNKMSVVMRLFMGYVPGPETIVEEVEKVPAASVVTYQGNEVSVVPWYDYDDFPKGEEPYSEYAVDECHNSFVEVMERCRSIQNGTNLLALSSGYDSRRIFAHLLDRKIDFKTCTVQMPHYGGQDVDAVYGKKIADDNHIEHTALKMETPQEWYKNRVRRIFNFDGLCSYHNWSVLFFNHYANENVAIYDGLFGDNFILPDTEFKDLCLDMAPKSKAWFLKDEFALSVQEIQKNFAAHWHFENIGKNRAIINFSLWQTRNSTAYWAQLQTKPGQIVICPYADLPYVEVMMRFRMEEDNRALPQKDVLNKYWPDLTKYPGTRELPANAVNIGNQRGMMDAYASKKILQNCMINNDDFGNFYRLLSLKGRFVFWLSKFIPMIKKNIGWWALPLPEISYWWANRPLIITVNEKK